MRATVIGAGVAGLAAAAEIARRGGAVEVLERAEAPGPDACSWWAGGMLAPQCERASAEPPVLALGREAVDWWEARGADVARRGTLVLAPARDRRALASFARRTEGAAPLDGDAIAGLEPDLAGRFGEGLFFAEEAHLDPRAALTALTADIAAHGGVLTFGAGAAQIAAAEARPGEVIDARGLAARDILPDLRGVAGEMLILRTDEVALSRPVRLLHPRWPLYIAPRGGGVFMIGATSVETGRRGHVTARGVMELLGAAYALHPAFADAEVLETGADARPAFPDNLPRLRRAGGRLCLNGLYRHGFLLAPAMARMAADCVFDPAHVPEVMDADPSERRAS